VLGDKGRKAWQEHKTDDVNVGFTNLPAGISGGVAQLTAVVLGEYKEGPLKGKPFVRFQFVAKAPATHNGVTVEGTQVNLMIPICDTNQAKGWETRKTYELKLEGTTEGWTQELLNEFKKLLGTTELPDATDADAIVAALNEDKPHTKFDTRGWTPPASKEKPNPTEMVFTSFKGRCEFTGDGAANAVDDKTGTATDPSANGAAHDEGSSDDVNALAEAADATPPDDTAIDRLKALAQEAGVDLKDVDGASSWTEVAGLIEAAQGGASEPAPAAKEGAPWVPKVEEIYTYEVRDPKSKKMKKIDVEVQKVFQKNKTVDLLSVEDKKTKYAGISWDLLK
jgi:hypothetical protein